MRSDNEKSRRYFAAANSAGGFVNYFPQIFGAERCRRLYVIKGGPGTGKSSFMRNVGAQAEAKGFGVTYYYCSSDPASLDGIFIEGLSVGLVDGTAPHVWEPSLVGAFEQIVNLGAFWNADMLADKRETVEALTKEKKACYGRAYRYLTAYGEVRRAADDVILPLVDGDKLSRAAARSFKRYAPPAANFFCEKVGLCDSIGMAGRVRFDTYERFANTRICVRDLGGTAHLFLAALYALCRRHGVSVGVSYDPILPERIDALALLDNGTVFSLKDVSGDTGVVNMRRFVQMDGYREGRTRRKESGELCTRLLACAEQEFAAVRRYHFELETLYGEAMDFGAKEQFEVAFCQNLFVAKE